MNQKALDLGLTNTHFETPHGLDSDGHYTTAYELALLSNYALKNKTFAQIVGSKEYTITINDSPKQLSNTNELLGNLNGVYGIKTGFTNGANRCLVTACKRGNMDIICVVLGADTKKFRTQDSIKLINYAFDNFKPIDIFNKINNNFDTWKKENLRKIKINKSISNNINLQIKPSSNCPISEEIKSIPIRSDLINSFNINVDCPMYFEAPISISSKVGTIKITVSDYCSFEYDIFCSTDLKRKKWNNCLYDLFKNYSTILNTQK